MNCNKKHLVTAAFSIAGLGLLLTAAATTAGALNSFLRFAGPENEVGFAFLACVGAAACFIAAFAPQKNA